jgi:hypothetical protein
MDALSKTKWATGKKTYETHLKQLADANLRPQDLVREKGLAWAVLKLWLALKDAIKNANDPALEGPDKVGEARKAIVEANIYDADKKALVLPQAHRTLFAYLFCASYGKPEIPPLANNPPLSIGVGDCPKELNVESLQLLGTIGTYQPKRDK